jgi:hypothetical protein
MVFNTTFNNDSAISWRSIILVEKTGVPRKKPTTCRKSLINLIRFEPTIVLAIGTDCIGSCKSNYHTITTTTAPGKCRKLNPAKNLLKRLIRKYQIKQDFRLSMYRFKPIGYRIYNVQLYK